MESLNQALLREIVEHGDDRHVEYRVNDDDLRPGEVGRCACCWKPWPCVFQRARQALYVAPRASA